jgi:hypothetical protein
MASEASSISSTAKDQGESSNTQKVVDMKEPEQDQPANSNSNKFIDFMKLSKDDSFKRTKAPEHDFFSIKQVGSSSGFPNNNKEGKNENENNNKNKEKNLDSGLFHDYFVRKNLLLHRRWEDTNTLIRWNVH